MSLLKRVAFMTRVPARLSATALVLVVGGCFWQQQNYTEQMEVTTKNYAAIQRLNAMLGDGVTASESAFYIRPPKPAVSVAPSQGIAVQFEGGTGEGLMEVIVVMSNAGETVAEFMGQALATLNTIGKGPGNAQIASLQRQLDSHYGGIISFELRQAAANRQIGQATISTEWQIYFTDEATQKVMIAYLFAASKHAEVGDAIDASLSSVALASKFSQATGGGGGRASAPAKPAAKAP